MDYGSSHPRMLKSQKIAKIALNAVICMICYIVLNNRVMTTPKRRILLIIFTVLCFKKSRLILLESIIKTCLVVLTFESMDENECECECGHSNETSLAVLLHGAICFSIFYKMKLSFFFLNFNIWHS